MDATITPSITTPFAADVAKVRSLKPRELSLAQIKALPGAKEVLGKTKLAFDKALNEFEAFFMSDLMKRMQATVQHSDFMGRGIGEKMFEPMLADELTRKAAHGGRGLGLSNGLRRQFAPAVFGSNATAKMKLADVFNASRPGAGKTSRLDYRF